MFKWWTEDHTEVFKACLAGTVVVVAFFAGITGIEHCGKRQGAKVERQRFQAEAIERGYAEYNATTGEWQWKEVQ